jgi:hypothetical protein
VHSNVIGFLNPAKFLFYVSLDFKDPKTFLSASLLSALLTDNLNDLFG